ncbi:hypothetical protein CH063_01673 [Colletotrichum higginsianum]|uniref:Uncharacterized protein n=2 Tax=Colletotrichum higginsianum TaxID=80884 RepID=H1VAP7_COLHI|nr:hypothetical protein CH63R_03399 [Colletotrichum higginsianum IMI 349063]OBR14673.1 hypothetical protein CH63R_03399 [Colletotrichum higginsianum IMI 349063]TID01795.1 hypothetical protein CH35J_004766 [Colletotrichum higginsianum]CCF37300.1 hypothetical protein CH063_01673 [Colletotrichum higginsianum]
MKATTLLSIIASVAVCSAGIAQSPGEYSLFKTQAGDPNCVTGGGSCSFLVDRCCAGGACLGGVCSTD